MSELSETIEGFKVAVNEARKMRSELHGRLDDMEAMIDRQSLGAGGRSGLSSEDRERRDAIMSYVRAGDRGIGPDVQAALSVGSDPEGGYWVTPDMRGRMVELIRESSPIRQLASVQSIGTDALEGLNDLDEASAGWVEEQGARPETSTPGIGKWRIPVHEQYAQPKTTQRVLDDADFGVGSWLTRKIAEKFGRMEASAFINGDGVGKPRGFLTYPAGTPSATDWDVIEQIKTGASGAFASSSPADVLFDSLMSLRAEYLGRASWVMSRSTLAAAAKLKDGQGNYLLTVGDIREKVPFVLLGYPVVLADDMPAIGADSLSIAVGDFASAYQVVDRLGISLLRDPFTTKGYVKFYARRRVGGDVVNFDALKLIKFAS